MNTCSHDSSSAYNNDFYCDACETITGRLLPCPRTGEVTAGCMIETGGVDFRGLPMRDRCPDCKGMGAVHEYV